ncbi:hypothetical protein PISMIDRAFT_79380, partial [Pisolithus microcarpus 441]
DAVLAVAFVDESQVVGGYFGGDIRRWRIEDGQQQGQTLNAGDPILSIAVSQDGRWIVSGDRGKKATVWNAATHERVSDTECESAEYGIFAVDISSDCTKFVAASLDGADNVRMFGIPSGTPLLPPLSHSWIYGVKFCPDGSRFATASETGVRIYST